MKNIDCFIYEAIKKGFNIDSVCVQTPNSLQFAGNNNIINVHSAAKTITSLAFALFLKEYRQISISDKIISFFPEYNSCLSKNTEYITIRDLLHMQSGKYIQSLFQKNIKQDWNQDWAKWFFEYPVESLPGTYYYYSSHCCYMIGRIIAKISQVDVNDFLEDRLWRPLAINKPFWSKCPAGYTNCAGNLMIKCTDLAKIGWTILNKGEYNSIDLNMERNYVENMYTDIVCSSDPFGWNYEECNCGYGYFLWRCKGNKRFRIWGAGGNFSVIDFPTNKCITITAIRDEVNWKSHNDQDLLRLIVKMFLT